MTLFAAFLFGLLGGALRALIGYDKHLSESGGKGAFDVKKASLTALIGGLGGVAGLFLLPAIGVVVNEAIIIVFGFFAAVLLEEVFSSLRKKLLGRGQ